MSSQSSFKTRVAALGAALLAGTLALTACTGSASSGANTVHIVGFSVLEAANAPIEADFQATPEGEGVDFSGSYGASGDQSRAVASGLDADYVHFSLETDVTRLVDTGLVDADWKDQTATNGVLTSSVVVFVVRPGNPKNITGWDDLIKPGVEIVTPDPGSSGSARWNILAAWAHAAAGAPDEAAGDAAGTAFLTKLLTNTVALPSSARDATTAFTSGVGDVLLSYENEAITARANGTDVDYVIPSDTLLIENTGALLKTASPEATDFFHFLTTAPAQEDYASVGFRPVIDGISVEVPGANDPSNPFPDPDTLFTIDGDFGGWAAAAPKFFGDGEDGNPLGLVFALQAELGKGATS